VTRSSLVAGHVAPPRAITPSTMATTLADLSAASGRFQRSGRTGRQLEPSLIVLEATGGSHLAVGALPWLPPSC